MLSINSRSEEDEAGALLQCAEAADGQQGPAGPWAGRQQEVMAGKPMRPVFMLACTAFFPTGTRGNAALVLYFTDSDLI